MSMTRDPRDLADNLRHIAGLLESLGELVAEAEVIVSVDGPFLMDDPTDAKALVEQIATLTGTAPTWKRNGNDKYGWYQTMTSDDTTTWQLRCSAFAEHPDGDLKAEVERLRTRLAELEADAEDKFLAGYTGWADTDDTDDEGHAIAPATSGECGGGCPTS